MTYKQNTGDSWKMLVFIILTMLCFLLFAIMTSCKTRYITQEIPVIVHDKDSIVSVQHYHTHDTLMMRDSVFTIIQGDTIRIERWHTLQSINNVVKVDTLWRDRAVEKPVTITKTEIKETNHLNWWQKSLAWIGGILLALGAGFGGFKIWKFFS